jgi:predicted O-methyltransferase YrrM
MNADLSTYTEEQIWEAFHGSGSFSKHLLTVYSLAIGLNAKTIVDLGIGSTTRALRMAAKRMGAKVLSCDMDAERYSYLREQQDENWELFFGASEKFIDGLSGPIDLVVHDAAHDYYQVKLDLERILPKMRTFGLICVHDTQQPDLNQEMLAAIKDATQGHPISMTNLPFSAGLAIIRIEAGDHPPIDPATGLLPDGRTETELLACPMRFTDDVEFAKADTSARRWVHWRLRKLVKGF